MGTQTQQVRVLVAGFDHENNTLTRALRQYAGCEVLYTGADGNRFPTDVDIAIVQRNLINKSKFESIKETFQAKNTPMLMATQGFSHIKPQFENFLFERAKNAPAEPVAPKQIHRSTSKPFNPAMQELMQAAIANPEVPKEMPAVDTFKSEIEVKHEEDRSRAHHPKEILDKVYGIVLECQKADMGGTETCEMLKAEGLVRANGKDYIPQDVYTMRMSIKNLGWKPAKKSQEPKPTPIPSAGTPIRKSEAPIAMVDKVGNPVKVEGLPIPTLEENPLTLIGEVLADQKIPQERKLAIIAKIQSGEIKTRHTNKVEVTDAGILYLTRGTFISPTETQLRLTKAEADLVLSSLGVIAKFVSEGKV